MTVFELLKISARSRFKVTMEATVATGLEYSALCECREKLMIDSEESLKSRGRVYFNVRKTQVKDVLSLRSIDHVYVIPFGKQGIGFSGSDKDKDIDLIAKFIPEIDLATSIEIWQDVFSFHGIAYPTKTEFDSNIVFENDMKSKIDYILKSNLNFETLSSFINQCPNNEGCYVDLLKKIDEYRHVEENGGEYKHVEENGSINSNLAKNDCCERKIKANKMRRLIYSKLDRRENVNKVLKFRATCYRSGKHVFGSQDVERHVGGTLQDTFNWVVDLSVYDLEFVINVNEDEIYFGIALTRESKHHRNITHFGLTTLRSTVCFNLLQLASPKSGDIIVDPLCGGGSISIEGSLAFKNTFSFGGDVDLKAVNRAIANISNLESKAVGPDIVLWDVKHLPLCDSSVDIFVSDLPFGKRMGSKSNNKVLYKYMLMEMARVARPTIGQAVLLSADRRSLILALKFTSKFWSLKKLLTVNIGGVSAAVCVLWRSDTAVP